MAKAPATAPGSLPEGVSSVGSTGPMVYSPLIKNSEIFERLRSSYYTPSVSPCGLPAPSEREPGNAPQNVNHPPAGCFVSGRVIFGLCVGVMFCHSSGCLRNRGVGGRFSSPLRNSETFYRLRSSDDTPSASLRSAAPSEREPGTVGLYHSSCRSETGTLRAIFIAPTKTQKFLHSTIHRVARKPQDYGRFSSPLRNSEDLTLYHSSKYTPSVTPFGRASSLREGAGNKFYHASCCFRAGGVRAGCIGWRLRCRVPGGGPFAPGGG